MIKLREMEMMQQINFENKPSTCPVMICNVNTYKGIADIASHVKIQAKLPETLIFGHGFDTPTLLFTNEEGYIQTQSRLVPSQIDIIIQIFET